MVTSRGYIHIPCYQRQRIAQWFGSRVERASYSDPCAPGNCKHGHALRGDLRAGLGLGTAHVVLRTRRTTDSAHASGHTWRRALPASLVGLAVEFTWAAGESVIVPFLLEAGLAPSLSGLVFIANPLVTIPLHPVLGAWSDRCQSRLGRRRPVQPKPFSRLSLCGAHS